jgi:hypothetical protein
MDGGLLGQPRMTTLPSRIDALGSAASRHPSWAEVAEASRCFGLGLIVRGLQPSQLVLVADCRGPLWLPVVCGVMGAGGVVAPCDVDAPIDDVVRFIGRHRCKIVIFDQESRLECLAERSSRLPSLLALVGPDGRPGRPGRPVVLGLRDLLTLGRAVHALDPGMWRECLAEIRPADPALKPSAVPDDPGGTISHQDCERALSPCLAEPAILADGLYSLLAKSGRPPLASPAVPDKESPA